MGSKIVKTCDRCGRTEDEERKIKILSFDIRWEGDRLTPDLCETDAGPLRDLIEHLPDSAKPKKRTRMDDISFADPADIPKTSQE